jgi:hypothetical protein
MRRIEEHRWIKPSLSPDPIWVKHRYLLVEENPDVLVAFYAMHGQNNVVTITLQARREGTDWFDTNHINKDVLAEYVDFLKEQLA